MTDWAKQLDALPRLSLIHEPTPLHAAPRLSAKLGGAQIWFKRDDLIPVAYGGNKVRSLDAVIADALAKGADTLVTGAGVLSNHVRATAGVASLIGLACRAVYWGAQPVHVEGNHRFAVMLCADIHFTGDCDRASVDAALAKAASVIRARGGHPYVIPRGGACPLAALAHTLAVRETLAQCASLGVSPKGVIMAVGGGATLAGWLLGTALFHAPWRIDAFTVSRPASEAIARAQAVRRAPVEAARAEMVAQQERQREAQFREHLAARRALRAGYLTESARVRQQREESRPTGRGWPRSLDA
jgi:D-cysteine desulfhydrase